MQRYRQEAEGTIYRATAIRAESKTDDQVNMEMPMMEAAGHAGPVLVFRPWAEPDIADAMVHVTSPSLENFEKQMDQFVR